MRRSKGFGSLAATLLVIVLAGCSSADVPDELGLYAVDDDGEFQRLDGSPKWERKTWLDRENLRPETRFVARHPALDKNSRAKGNQKITLTKVGWVRSEIRAGGEIGPSRGRQWIAAPIPELEVPLRLVQYRSDAVRIAPLQGALNPGLYSLRVDLGGSKLQARFGVAWAKLDQKHYATAHCIDRYIQKGTARYQPCAKQRLAASTTNPLATPAKERLADSPRNRLASATKGLQIRLGEPDKRAIGGKVSITVQGWIFNDSRQARNVPPLQGQLKDSKGHVLHQWAIPRPTSQLDPGGYASFKTIADNAPPTATNVTVTFQSALRDQRSPPNVTESPIRSRADLRR
jgi:hypothetical protein